MILNQHHARLILICFLNRAAFSPAKALQQLLPLGLLDASELLLGGCSAGAVAALQLGDQLAELVRRAQRAQRGAQTAAEEVFVAILWPGDVDPCQSVACACLCRHMFWYAMCLGER